MTQGINGVVEVPPFVGVPLYLRPGVEVGPSQIGFVFLKPGFIFEGLIPADFTITVNC